MRSDEVRLGSAMVRADVWEEMAFEFYKDQKEYWLQVCSWPGKATEVSVRGLRFDLLQKTTLASAVLMA